MNISNPLFAKSLCWLFGHKAGFKTCSDAAQGIYTCARCCTALEELHVNWIDRALCWWFGCLPRWTHIDDGYDIDICDRCGIEGIENMQLDMSYWDSRHQRFFSFMRYWFFRKWWPRKCEDCGKRFGDCSDDCLPF